MATPVVTNTAKRPDQTPAPDAVVSIELVGEAGKRIDGYVSASDYTIYGLFKPTLNASTAVWSQALVPNSLITPSGSMYKVTTRIDGDVSVDFIVVTDVAGPLFVEDILEDGPPGPLPSNALKVHINDTTDAHDASAVSFAPAVGVAAENVQAAIVELAGDATAIDARVDAVEAVGETVVDTWTDLQELEPVERRTAYVESQRMLYRANGIGWERLGKERGYHYVDEFGATPGTRDAPPSASSYEAFRAAIIAASLNYDGSLRGAGIVIVGNGRYKLTDDLSWAEMGLNSEAGDGNRFGMYGVGGGFGSQSQIGGPISMVEFTGTSGFRLDVHLADSLSMRDLYIGSGGTVFTARDGAGALTRFDNVYASGGNASDPAVDFRGSFSVDWEGGALQATTNAPASFMFGSDDVVEYSWFFRFKRVVVLGRGVVEQITDAPNSNGEGNAMVDCYSENFDLGGPMWKMEVVDVTDANLRYPDFERVFHSDRLGPADYLEISAPAGASITNSQGGGRFASCGNTGANEAHVRTTGAGICSGAFSVDGMPLLVVEEESAGGVITVNRQLGEYEALASQAGNTAFKSRVHGDAAVRYLRTVDGAEYVGGDGTVLSDCTRTTDALGTPEGRITAGPGSTHQSRNLGKLFVKETGTGNTGWVQK